MMVFGICLTLEVEELSLVLLTEQALAYGLHYIFVNSSSSWVWIDLLDMTYELKSTEGYLHIVWTANVGVPVNCKSVFWRKYSDTQESHEVPLSQMSHDILEDDHMQWHSPLIRHYTNLWPCYQTRPNYWTWLFPNCERFSYDMCNGCDMPISRGRLLLRIPGHVPLWDLQVF